MLLNREAFIAARATGATLAESARAAGSTATDKSARQAAYSLMKHNPEIPRAIEATRKALGERILDEATRLAFDRSVTNNPEMKMRALTLLAKHTGFIADKSEDPGITVIQQILQATITTSPEESIPLLEQQLAKLREAISHAAEPMKVITEGNTE